MEQLFVSLMSQQQTPFCQFLANLKVVFFFFQDEKAESLKVNVWATQVRKTVFWY